MNTTQKPTLLETRASGEVILMNTDFRIKIGFSRHTKTLKLKRRLKAEGVLALIGLWEYTALNRPNGLLKDMDCEDIAIAAGWDGDGEHLVDTLVKIGWLDETQDGYRVHDWTQHNEWAAKAENRSEYFRDLAAKRRKKKRRSDNGNGTHSDTHNDTLYATHSDTHNDTLYATHNVAPATRNAPILSPPYPSSPIPTYPIPSHPIPTQPEEADSYREQGEGKTVKAHDCAKTETAYPNEFEEAWRLYPERNGGNSKSAAYRAWKARIREGASVEDLTQGTKRYAEYCQGTGKTRTQFVKQASTFYGPGKHYQEAWATPKNGRSVPALSEKGCRTKANLDRWLEKSAEKEMH